MDQPRPGKCNAQHANGRFCGELPLPGATRCLVHGGPIQQTSGLQTSLYSQRLRSTFKEAEDQKLYDEMPKSTDLSEEIKVARMRVIRYQTLLEQGTDVLFVKDKPKKPLAQAIAEDGSADFDCKQVALNVHDLLRDQLALLRTLAVSQDAIHPGSDIGGNLRLTITLAGAPKQRLPIPDLTDDSNPQRLLPATRGSAVDVEAVRSDRAGTTGYEDDDEP